MPNSRTLLIMRHAKSSWADRQQTDHERPLNKRGLRDAPQMGQFLVQHKITIDRLVASTAARAKTTAQIVAAANDNALVDQLVLNEDFYLAPPRVYLEHLRGIDDSSIQTVMVVGHNPGLENLVYHLSGRHETMPTAAIACFEVTSLWRDLTPVSCQFNDVWRPKEVLEHYR